MKVKFPDGENYEISPISFTEEACDFLVQFEKLGESSGLSKIGSFMKLFRVVLIDSLSEKYTADEVKAIVKSIKLNLSDPNSMAFIGEINAAFLGIEPSKKEEKPEEK